MKTTFVQNTSNALVVLDTIDRQINRCGGVEGLTVVFGEPGAGKSASTLYAANRADGVFLRAKTTWCNVNAMLRDFCREFGIDAPFSHSALLDKVIAYTRENARAIFIDEADYILAGSRRQVALRTDTLRDIYDMTGVPLILIGMEGFAKGLHENARFARRITQWIELKALNLRDVEKIVKARCEVALDEEMMRYVHEEVQGNTGRLINAIALIEEFARANGLECIEGKTWGERKLYFDQPTFSSRRRLRRG